ncbi:hypothetical protein HY479_02995 [Candidatus Uhrbacteria bacterium]|nr:hypothetical protein [Candidatus Uhrbacteria bacterium]
MARYRSLFDTVISGVATDDMVGPTRARRSECGVWRQVSEEILQEAAEPTEEDDEDLLDLFYQSDAEEDDPPSRDTEEDLGLHSVVSVVRLEKRRHELREEIAWRGRVIEHLRECRTEHALQEAVRAQTRDRDELERIDVQLRNARILRPPQIVFTDDPLPATSAALLPPRNGKPN